MPGKSHVQSKSRARPVSRSHKAGLHFPVGRTASYLRKGRYAERTSGEAPVFMAAVLEYLAAEVLELAGNTCSEHKKKTIAPRHILLAISNDEELARLMNNTMIHEGGINPKVMSELFPKKSAKVLREAGATQEM